MPLALKERPGSGNRRWTGDSSIIEVSSKAVLAGIHAIREKIMTGSRMRAVAIGVVAIIILFVGVSVVTGQVVYSSESQLIPSYTTPYSEHYWNGALFNNSNGKTLAFFVFALRSTNQSQAPIGITLSWGPNTPPGRGTSSDPVYIDSLEVIFSSDNFANWPDVGVRASSTAGGLSPTQVLRGTDGQAIISYQDLGFYGTATETVDLWFQLLGVGPSASVNHTATMTVNFMAHVPHSMLIGQSYSAQAVFHLIVDPSGSVSLSEN
jgi:hypothetical protein